MFYCVFGFVYDYLYILTSDVDLVDESDENRPGVGGQSLRQATVQLGRGNGTGIKKKKKKEQNPWPIVTLSKSTFLSGSGMATMPALVIMAEVSPIKCKID